MQSVHFDVYSAFRILTFVLFCFPFQLPFMPPITIVKEGGKASKLSAMVHSLDLLDHQQVRLALETVDGSDDLLQLVVFDINHTLTIGDGSSGCMHMQALLEFLAYFRSHSIKELAIGIHERCISMWKEERRSTSDYDEYVRNWVTVALHLSCNLLRSASDDILGIEFMRDVCRSLIISSQEGIVPIFLCVASAWKDVFAFDDSEEEESNRTLLTVDVVRHWIWDIIHKMDGDGEEEEIDGNVEEYRRIVDRLIKVCGWDDKKVHRHTNLRTFLIYLHETVMDGNSRFTMNECCNALELGWRLLGWDHAYGEYIVPILTKSIHACEDEEEVEGGLCSMRILRQLISIGVEAIGVEHTSIIAIREFLFKIMCSTSFDSQLRLNAAIILWEYFPESSRFLVLKAMQENRHLWRSCSSLPWGDS
jgi:hypothetical protein